MDLLALYDEILFKIILSLHDPTDDFAKRQTSDRKNLFNILCCARLRDIIYKCWDEIVDYYTIRIDNVLGDIEYYFCERLHNNHDRPALIQDDSIFTRDGKISFTIWKWYRYGKLHRDNAPAIINEYNNTCEYYRYGYVMSAKTLSDDHLIQARRFN